MSRFLPYHLNLEAGKTIQSPELSQGVSQYLPCPVLLTQANTGEGPESIRQLDSYIQMLSLGVYAFRGGDFIFFPEQPGGHFHAGTEPRRHPLHLSGEPGIETSANEALAVARGKELSRVAK